MARKPGPFLLPVCGAALWGSGSPAEPSLCSPSASLHHLFCGQQLLPGNWLQPQTTADGETLVNGKRWEWLDGIWTVIHCKEVETRGKEKLKQC